MCVCVCVCVCVCAHVYVHNIQLPIRGGGVGGFVHHILMGCFSLSGRTIRRGGEAMGRAVGNFFGLTEESQVGSGENMGWQDVTRRRAEVWLLALPPCPAHLLCFFFFFLMNHLFERVCVCVCVWLYSSQQQHTNFHLLTKSRCNMPSLLALYTD